MRTILIMFTIIWSCSLANAYTLTFDDVPSGTNLNSSIYCGYGSAFSDGFKAIDHTTSTWGQPNSGTNVIVWDGEVDCSTPPRLLFGYYTSSSAIPYGVTSVNAYFSTQQGVMVRITVYSAEDSVTSVVIGSANESWNNRLVEISSSNGPFDMLKFEGVNSPYELLGFCADDITITPAPEP